MSSSNTCLQTYSSLTLLPFALSKLNDMSRADGFDHLKNEHHCLQVACHATHLLYPEDPAVKEVHNAFQVLHALDGLKDGNFPQIRAEAFSELSHVTEKIVSTAERCEKDDEEALKALWSACHVWFLSHTEAETGMDAEEAKQFFKGKLNELTSGKETGSLDSVAACKLGLCSEPPENYKEYLKFLEITRAESVRFRELQLRNRDFIDTSDGNGTPSYYEKWAGEDTRVTALFQEWYKSANTNDTEQGQKPHDTAVESSK